MTTEWIVYVLLLAGLVACAAAAVDDVLRRAAMPTRWVWVAALLATTVFTAMSMRRTAPTFNPLVTAKMSVSALPTFSTRGGLLETIAHARAWVGGATARIVGAAHYGLSASVQVSLIVAWVTTSAGMLAILFLVHRGMDRERRRWPLALLFDVSVRITPSEGPAVVGITTPEIVVPRWLLARSAEEQRLVVMHEREHITARDHLLLLGGLFIAALLPWHPVVWWAVSRLRLAIELDCDARVLHRGVQVRSYGNLLIDIAGQCAGHRVGALALADQPSHLERRLLAMKNTKPRFTLVRTGSLAAIAMLAVAMACEARLPTSAEVEKMDVASWEKAVVQAKQLDEAGAKNVVYKVAGVVVSADKAHALSANHIARDNV
ncbi:MAG: M56 family metallopeptidase, partial [Polaromonas sp.]|nr:M56 family metallopeptidase [Gemmatimonadaceae bacterium]